MSHKPEDFAVMSSPSTLWRTTVDEYGEIKLEFNHGNLQIHHRDDGLDEGGSHGGEQDLTAEAVQELRDQLTAWLQWKGIDRRCPHTVARFAPYCAEMTCHNYAGRHPGGDLDGA